MPRSIEPLLIFSITNSNKQWVSAELDALRIEWVEWLALAKGLPVSDDYDEGTCADAVKDGWTNIRKHGLLREKTLVFIGNNFSGYEFIFNGWHRRPYEDTLSRIAVNAPMWVHRLETLGACADYAQIPDGFWKSKGKELVDKVVSVGTEKGAEIAATYLRNPMG